jgi:hypothetical protein
MIFAGLKSIFYGVEVTELAVTFRCESKIAIILFSDDKDCLVYFIEESTAGITMHLSPNLCFKYNVVQSGGYSVIPECYLNSVSCVA